MLNGFRQAKKDFRNAPNGIKAFQDYIFSKYKEALDRYNAANTSNEREFWAGYVNACLEVLKGY